MKKLCHLERILVEERGNSYQVSNGGADFFPDGEHPPPKTLLMIDLKIWK